jgi:hypothetical protein
VHDGNWYLFLFHEGLLVFIHLQTTPTPGINAQVAVKNEHDVYSMLALALPKPD